MLKYYDSATTFAEFPNEISLCINITNCPCLCAGCSEPWLKEDIGEILNMEKIDELITLNPDVTLFGFMGGDNDHRAVADFADYIHKFYPTIKVGIYSGLDCLDPILLKSLDYYKIGKWIMPQGPVEKWAETNCGPITFPFSNQLMFKKVDNNWINITSEFRKHKINNLEKEIIK